MSRHSGLIVPALLVLCLAVVACVDEGRPETCDAEAVTVEVTVMANGMEPNPAAVCRGQDVSLELNPEVDGVFHVHGLDDTLPATTITAGEQLSLRFTPEVTGQFPVELHPAGDQGIAIGIFTVHER
jgi:hypothetical protein